MTISRPLTHRLLVLLLVVLASLALQGCAASRSASQAEAADDEFKPITVHSWDRWRIAGQPVPADLDRSARSGTTTVINLRTQAEIDRLDFDPAAETEARGMRYVHIPMGGDDGYTTEQVGALASAMDGVEGPVLLHCASGGRARLLWAAYQIDHEGVPVDEAMLRMQEVGGQPTAMERLLGRRIYYRLGEPLESEDAQSP
ncbi:MAG: beta-lactamase hydrolase domain-containing protein [Phycisphaerales bacterium]